MKKKAVSIKYKEGWPAPLVTAKSQGEGAQLLLEIAQKHGIHILKDEDLAENLFVAPVGEFVPPDFYEVFAEILAFVYKLKESDENSNN